MRCYICNKEIVDNPSNANECKAHGEHIIHNGIRGKLISKTILCETCGGRYSKEDSAFCKIFDPFIAALNDQLIPADHGKGTDKVLRGIIFDKPTFNTDDPGLKVTIKKGVVAPIEPYYEINGNQITLYAEKHRIDQFEKVVAKELEQNKKNISDFSVVKITDIHDKGYLAYYFSKDNLTFNQDFKKGIVKIATEFALDNKIPREQLSNVLIIKADGTASIDCTNTKVIPFVPTTLFDCIFEDYRYKLEDGYPSHTLKLFTTRYDDGTVVLYCYLDLFCTFQYYVVLNENYRGEDINYTYSQRLITETKERLDVTQYNPSDLDVIIREYGIDMSQCKATSYDGQLKYIQNYINKYPLQKYNFQKSLENARERIQSLVLSYLRLKGKKFNDLKTAVCTLSMEEEKLPSSIQKIIDTFIKNADSVDYMQLFEAFRKSVDENYYRKYCFDVIEGDVMLYSLPDEIIKIYDKNNEAIKEYTYTKFSHLSCFCYNPSSLK